LISVGGMAQGGEWSRLSNQRQAFLRVYTFSPGCTLISVGRMAQGGEWSRFKRQDSYSSLFEKNSPDISLFYFEGDILSYLTDVSERLAQMIQFILTIFFCASWHQMIVMETACLQTVEIYHCSGFVPLFVTMCHSLSSSVLPWINTSVFYQLILYQLS
jgi:hypothetical protein